MSDHKKSQTTRHKHDHCRRVFSWFGRNSEGDFFMCLLYSTISSSNLKSQFIFFETFCNITAFITKAQRQPAEYPVKMQPLAFCLCPLRRTEKGLSPSMPMTAGQCERWRHLPCFRIGSIMRSLRKKTKGRSEDRPWLCIALWHAATFQAAARSAAPG